MILIVCLLFLWLISSTLAIVYRHIGISLDMLLKLVRIFGSMIYSAISASSPVGIDIEAEQRCVDLTLLIFTLFFMLLTALKRFLFTDWSGTTHALWSQKKSSAACLPLRGVFLKYFKRSDFRLFSFFFFNPHYLKAAVLTMIIISSFFAHRRGGTTAKSAHALTLALQEVS